MPRLTAALATRWPMAPKPITPKVFPWISGPTNWDFPFSTSFPTSSPSLIRDLAQLMPSTIFLEEISIPASTSSLTALAFAPGVLNTTIPVSLHLSTGMLFTPAPARAMARRLAGNGISFILKLRTSIASGFDISDAISYLSREKSPKPAGEILFNVWILYVMINQLFAFSNFSINSTNFTTPSRGMAL